MSFKEVDPPVSRSQSAVKAIVYAVVILLILASLSYGAVLYPTDETGFVMAFAVVVALSFALVAHYAFEKVSIACIPIFPVIASTSFAALDRISAARTRRSKGAQSSEMASKRVAKGDASWMDIDRPSKISNRQL